MSRVVLWYARPVLWRSRARQAGLRPAAWWPTILPLSLMLASDYKLRSRADDQAISGSVDLMILVEIAVYGAVALFLYLRFGLRPPARRTTGLLFAAWAWVGYAALTALWSPYFELGVVRATQLIITMAVAHVVATRATVSEMHLFAHTYIVILLISVGIGVAHPFHRTKLTLDRFNWLYVHPVIAGIYLGIGVILLIAYLTRRKTPGAHRWHPGAYLASLAVVAGALVATGTRGAALGCAVGVVVLLTVANGARGRVDVLVLGMATMAIVVLGFMDVVLGFVIRGDSSAKLMSLNSRTELWALALRAYAEEPLFGHGLGASRGLFLQAIGLGGGHNAFINALVDNGTVGVVVFATLLITVAVVALVLRKWRHLRPDAGLVLGLLAFFVVDGITAEGLAAAANVAGIWLFVLVAWLETLRRDPDVPDTVAVVSRATGAIPIVTVPDAETVPRRA